MVLLRDPCTMSALIFLAIVELLLMAKIQLCFFQQGARVPSEEHNLADPAGCELLP